MPRFLITVLMALLLAAGSVAQEAQTSEDTPGDVASAAGADKAEPEEPVVDDSDLDEQTYEEDDDDFVPTEEIPADEPIPFPTNI